MRRFLRKSTVEREPLAVAMIGVRMGDRVLQIGLGEPRLTSTLAARPGLSGHAAIVVHDQQDAERAQAAAGEAGLLIDVHVAPMTALPLADGTFDVVIVHNAASALAALETHARTQAVAEGRRVLRDGGRLIALETGTPGGLRAVLRRAPAADPGYEASGGTAAVLEAAGFKAVRLLADRDGYRFFEGLKT
jgi:ubiquinone/menaquinone biosynthesis C-methylase UbiE